jgi:hypothetical protein
MSHLLLPFEEHGINGTQGLSQETKVFENPQLKRCVSNAQKPDEYSLAIALIRSLYYLIPILHHHPNALFSRHNLEILQWVAVENQHVGAFADLDSADFAFQGKEAPFEMVLPLPFLAEPGKLARDITHLSQLETAPLPRSPSS